MDAFADEIERKLSENRHKGDREGWARMTAVQLIQALEQEVFELRVELLPALGYGEPEPVNPMRVRRECADVGAFAMMIADVVGRMPPKVKR